MVTFITCLCDITNTRDRYTTVYVHIGTRDNTHIPTTQMLTWFSLCFMLHFVFFIFSFLSKLVTQKSRGAVGKGKNLLTIASCALVRCISEYRQPEKRCFWVTPLQQDVPRDHFIKETKQMKETNSPAIKRKIIQSLNTSTRRVLKSARPAMGNTVGAASLP